MKAISLAALMGGMALTACNLTTPETKSTASASEMMAAKQVHYGNGKPFHVETRRTDGYFALVSPAEDEFYYNGNDARAAASAATGCPTTMSGGVLEFMNIDVKTEDLRALQKVVTNFKGWRVDLKC